MSEDFSKLFSAMMEQGAEMARLFARFPGAVERGAEIAERIGFDLGQLRYEYPDEPVPPGKTAIQHLRDLAWAGADWRYPNGVPEKVRVVASNVSQVGSALTV